MKTQNVAPPWSILSTAQKVKFVIGLLGCCIPIAGFFFMVRCINGGDRVTQSATAEPTPAVDWKTINDGEGMLVASGIVTKVDAQNCQIFVKRSAWQNAKYDQKQTLGYIMAEYCAEHRGNLDAVWVDILDEYTGNKVGRYSRQWGFTVYDK